MFITLDAALERLLMEGLQNQINRHKTCAKLIRDKIREMGLQLLIDDTIASNTVSSVFLPTHISMSEFIEKMESKGFTVYPGKGPLKPKNMFQIANMGNIDKEMCHLFLQTMKETLYECKN